MHLVVSDLLCFASGWRPPTVETNFLTLGALILKLVSVEPRSSYLKSAYTLTASTILSVFSGREVVGLIPCFLGGVGCVQSQ